MPLLTAFHTVQTNQASHFASLKVQRCPFWKFLLRARLVPELSTELCVWEAGTAQGDG